MFFNTNSFLRYSLISSFLIATISFIPTDLLASGHRVMNQKRLKVSFLVVKEQKNDSAYQVIRQLLIENNKIINKVLGLRHQLSELEESIRLQEIYESIQSQQAMNESTENLKRSIKRRSYLSLGIGLVSSSLLLIGNDSDNDNVRYGGAILSLSIPIIAIISMKKQLNMLVPTTEIDYSMLQSGSYPHNQASREFFRNYVKAEIFALKAGLQKLDKINTSSLDKLNSGKDMGYLQGVIEDTDYIIRDLEGYYVFQIQKFNDLITNDYITLPLDQGSKEKLQQISTSINDNLSYLQKQRSQLLSNQKKINQLFE